MESQDRPSGRSMRGFASMDKERQKNIASKGGRAAHEKGTAHEFSPDEASVAARRGHERGTAHEFTREEARIAGRKGGLARAMNRAKAATEGLATPATNVAPPHPPEHPMQFAGSTDLGL
jgi:general stress protein YciG